MWSQPYLPFAFVVCTLVAVVRERSHVHWTDSHLADKFCPKIKLNRFRMYRYCLQSQCRKEPRPFARVWSPVEPSDKPHSRVR